MLRLRGARQAEKEDESSNEKESKVKAETRSGSGSGMGLDSLLIYCDTSLICQESGPYGQQGGVMSRLAAFDLHPSNDPKAPLVGTDMIAYCVEFL
eukprot:scaffold117308_cov20-Tisochrysis_lutea.AAC.3